MTFETFAKTFDTLGAVILLEGKRRVREEDEDQLIALGRILAKHTKRCIFRSGNAPGADACFTEGVCSVDPSRLQVITPYTGHRKSTYHQFDVITLDTLNLAAEHEVVQQSKGHKGMDRLIERYLSGNRDRFSIKAAYIIRDTVKVVGATNSKIPRAAVGIFYDDLDQPVSGGTGHTIRVCQRNNIPLIDQRVWFNWPLNEG